MKKYIDTSAGTITPGTKLRIVNMKHTTAPSAAFPDRIDHQAKENDGRVGDVTFIDDAGQIHGTWGGLALNPETDQFEIIKN